MTTIDTEALRALADAATDAMSGTWTVSGLDDAGRYGVMTDDPDLAGQYVAHGALEEVAEFIAAARTALPALLDALAERDAEVERLRGAVERLRERERALIRAKDADLDDLRHEVEARDVLVADVAKIAADAERWKADALPVMAGLQDLGRILGLRLGTSITGEAAADAARALVTRADDAEAKVRAVDVEAIEDYIAHMDAALPHQRIKCSEVASYLRAALATPEPTVQAWPQEDS